METQLDGDAKSRITFSLPRKIKDKLKMHVTWGVRSAFISKAVECALNDVEKGGYKILGAILAGEHDPIKMREEGDDEDSGILS